MLEQTRLEGEEINLPTSSTSDWILVLQDSITTDDLRQGCVSLFKQINSEMTLATNEVFHAVRFLKYATIHIEHRKSRHTRLLETIFPEEGENLTKVTSTLIKLIYHPSDKLRTVALSFFDVLITKSSWKCTIAVVVTGLLPQLFERLKPQEIPLNGTTIEFHRHIISIVDMVLSISTPSIIMTYLGIYPSSSNAKAVTSEHLDPIIQPFCTYLRHLVAPPVCRTDYHYGLSLLRTTKAFFHNIRSSSYAFSNAELRHFFEEVRANMTEEFASSLGLTMTSEVLNQLLYGECGRLNELQWVETFEDILARLSEGRLFSDLGLEAFGWFMSNRKFSAKLASGPNGTFSVEVDDGIISSKERPSTVLRTLLTPTRPDHAATILEHFESFTSHLNSAALLRDIKSGWFADLFDAITPSQLPFTNEYFSLHKYIIRTMDDYLKKIREYAESKEHDQLRSELDEICHSFFDQTRDYIVYLSLHPSALIDVFNDNIILRFFAHLFRPDFESSAMRTFRDDVRTEIDGAALSLPSPPFILTSELVCRLTDDEIIDIVDRIVALLTSDSPIDDDTILRICAFHTNQLKLVYLPKLFRNAGRTTEQYFHALTSLLSLPIDSFRLRPINSLLGPKSFTLHPTFNEWVDVDLATVGVVMPTIHEHSVSFNSASSQLLDFAVKALPKLKHCATRLTLSRLERLLSPFIDIFFPIFIQQSSLNGKERKDRAEVFIMLSKLCDYRAIAQCLSRIGFFSRIVGGLLDYNLFYTYKHGLGVFLRQTRYSSHRRPARETLHNTVPHFQEEGWQDILDLLLVQKQDSFDITRRIGHVIDMMQFHGANMSIRDMEMMQFRGANMTIRDMDMMQFRGANLIIPSMEMTYNETDLREDSESDDTD
ncbi:hypothetical protein BLNAU_20610 [Blattamonas nauphoetae]|uniref:Uncharacterized protein n=1 Tax=Blattamonas nauphoetae TaxID=2049346 RepID=A0ABQ9WY76_9EUKA|nr:hypothetical protein BLNAU_20610 [Blattamonas nauphoetae]